MSEQRWTAKLVADRFEEAADTLRRLPPVRVQGYICSWPAVVREANEGYGWNEALLRRGPPSAAAITRMDIALDWLRWLEPDDARLVWLRACRVPWKVVCWKVGLARTAAWQRWVIALTRVASGLSLSSHQSAVSSHGGTT